MPKATHEVEGEIRASNASDGNYQPKYENNIKFYILNTTKYLY